jgi:hypothetical protein
MQSSRNPREDNIYIADQKQKFAYKTTNKNK